jgi:hypothetical protein
MSASGIRAATDLIGALDDGTADAADFKDQGPWLIRDLMDEIATLTHNSKATLSYSQAMVGQRDRAIATALAIASGQTDFEKFEIVDFISEHSRIPIEIIQAIQEEQRR